MGFAVDLSHLTKQPIRYIGILVLSGWDNISWLGKFSIGPHWSHDLILPSHLTGAHRNLNVGIILKCLYESITYLQGIIYSSVYNDYIAAFNNFCSQNKCWIKLLFSSIVNFLIWQVIGKALALTHISKARCTCVSVMIKVGHSFHP